jgi:hypothetical protein
MGSRWSMTSLTRQTFVAPPLLFLIDIIVAFDANLETGVNHWRCGQLVDGSSPIMAKFSESLRY